MASKKFSEIEIDAIGEIMNISLGASATAVSTMLNTRVDITTPTVSVVNSEEFTFTNLQPAVGVEITYVDGLDGKNVMLLKRHDVKVIVELLMGMEIPDEEFELDEMNISAICEVMNQMMGASSTALSEFLGKVVNISTPTSFECANEDEFKDKYFIDEEEKVVVGFVLTIDGKMQSEFMNVMSPSLAKELVSAFLPEEMDETPAPAPAPSPAPAPAAPEPSPMANMGMAAMGASDSAPNMGMPNMGMPNTGMPNMGAPDQMPNMGMPNMGIPNTGMPNMGMPVSNDAMFAQQQMMTQMMSQIQMLQSQLNQVKEHENRVINAKAVTYPEYSGGGPGEEQPENLELVMGVPLEVSVEIGRTNSLVKDILDYTKGTLVVLDKQAGDQVDLFVNGQCIAKGDVVVIDDNFGIRITEILKRPEFI